MTSPFYPDKIPRNLQLEKDTIDIWCVSLDVDEPRLMSLYQVLSVEERSKAERMRIDAPRKHYVAARAILRYIIAAYMHEKPESLEFQYGPNDKPALSSGFSNKGVTFNMSHSHGTALYGVALGREIGVDIEKIRQDMSIIDLAKRFFSSREFEELMSLPAEDQTLGFFNCWTRKEAYLKATGQGLKFPLDNFDVSLSPGKPAELLEHRTDPEEVSLWTIAELDLGPAYAAALTVEGKGFTVSCKGFPSDSK
jgi:4'-phosphopantetheinyl transferase